ncbi:unnamed protein product, partial [Candidula unifasciata]
TVPTRSMLLVLTVYAVCENIRGSSAKVSDNPTSNIVTIVKRLQKKGQVRPRRSYLDNRIDTLPSEPVYFSQRNHDSFSAHELGRNYHQHYDVDTTQDALLGLLNPFDSKASQKEHQHLPTSDHRKHYKPLDLSSFPLPEEDDLGQDAGFDFSSLLPPTFDVTAPVSERAKQEADTIMDDFLNFLDLKASGALDQCLNRQK